MRVAVAGAGLGGLCLAQGLRRAGVDVQVYERDAGPDVRRQGYRLHMDARAGDSLSKCLPPRLLLLGDAIHAMSPARGSGANIALLDAAHLCDALTGGGDLVAAIGGYEERMRDYGFAAVSLATR